MNIVCSADGNMFYTIEQINDTEEIVNCYKCPEPFMLEKFIKKTSLSLN